MKIHPLIIAIILALSLTLSFASSVHAATLGGRPICPGGYHTCVRPCKPRHKPVHYPPVHHKPPTHKPPVKPCNCTSSVVLEIEKELCNGAKVKVRLVI